MSPIGSHAMRAGLLVLLALALVAGCGGDDEPPATANGCESVEKPAAREPQQIDPPQQELDPSETYLLTFDTSCGAFVVKLDDEGAPNTSASLVELARAGYFDDTIFHRIVPDFVIQGGDPTQTGEGGPGYRLLDKPPTDARYTNGVVAMAKTPSDPAGTSGSQFFVVTAADAGLPPDYAIVGTVTRGLDVVERIGELGDEAEQPTQPVVIRTVTVASRP
jgi:cyclophilin family peptidyl-prolyl cis-trans isomerase